MAFNITLYKMNKRDNSTELPTASTTSTNVSVDLLEGTSISNPTFILKGGTNYVGYNYIYCATFNRYYFVNDWVSDHNMWHINCQVDVLATYKSTIIASTQYVMRSASAFDEYATDNIYPTTGEVNTAKANIDSEILHGLPDTTKTQYILCTIGGSEQDPNASDTINGLHYYALAKSQVEVLLKFLNQNLDDFITWPSEISHELTQLLYDPFQYIVSLMYIPCGIPSDCIGNSVPVRFGYWTCGQAVQGHTLKIGTFAKYCKFAAARHPQALTHGKYLSRPPYTSRILHFQPFGDFSIQSDLMDIDDNVLWCKCTINPIAGDIRLEIKSTKSTDASATWEASPGRIIHTENSQYGIPLNLSKAAINPMQSVSGLGSLFSQGQSFPNINPFTILNARNQVEAGTTATVSSKGSQGSFMSILTSSYLTSYYKMIGDIDIEDRGRPYNRKVVLNTLSGFTVCADADISIISATKSEIEKIKSYMNEGFFIE